jgi:nitrogen fixation-related uncharacterized protein
MGKLINNVIRGCLDGIVLIIIIFIVIGAICAYNAYGNTWTVRNGQYKEVYDNKEECIKNKLMTGTTDECDDNSKVIYKNEEE